MKFEGVQELARWINVAQSTSVRRVSRFMEHHWNMPKPEESLRTPNSIYSFPSPRRDPSPGSEPYYRSSLLSLAGRSSFS